MRYRAQDVLSPIFQRQFPQQRFESRLILHVKNFLERSDLLFRQFHTIDDSAEKVDVVDVDMESWNPDAMERSDRHQQDFDFSIFSSPAVMFDADLREFTLSSALWLFEAQHFAGIEKPNRFRRFRKPRRDG